MKSLWSDSAAAAFVARHAPRVGEALALRTYSSRLIGAEPDLVLHGGGNTSVKATRHDLLGDPLDVLHVKASGHDLRDIEPEGHVALELEPLRRLRRLDALDDEAMESELCRRQLDPRGPTPSIETLVHACLPDRFVDHTHADAILVLTNQSDGEERIREALGDEVPVLPYLVAGFALAQGAAEARERWPRAPGLVWMHHGLVTWGETARESYERTIELVSRAEAYVDARARHPLPVRVATPAEVAEQRLARVAPLVRGRLARPTNDPDRPHRRVVLKALAQRSVLDFLGSERGRELAVSPPLTSDHLIRTKALPAWVEAPDYADEERLRGQIEAAVAEYAGAYRAYLERHRARLPPGIVPFDPRPRVVLLPGLGALCAGRDAREAALVGDITAHTLVAKVRVATMGGSYRGLREEQLFDMEYRPLQHAKLDRAPDPPLGGCVVLVTGAAGAIGSGICEALLAAGAQVAATDLPGPRLDDLVAELVDRFPERVCGVALDVTEPDSVREGFEAVSRAFGGVDQVVVNAGLAHVSSLEELALEDFRRLERVNTEGTLLVLAETARQLRRQGTGGDVVLVSTKNVFAPGARFGAYSATKAAAHQLARIASQELADQDVRVNMVSPDAVFSHGERPSGLWAEVGPDRMRARGLDASGLEAYYRDRNLLRARIRADHVANAVLFFLTRQTPTTGATLPVDGGLPDAAPR